MFQSVTEPTNLVLYKLGPGEKVSAVLLFTLQEEDEGESLEATLESLIAPARDYPGYDAAGSGAMAEWEVEDDPDLANEPVLTLDMQVRSHTDT